MKLAFYYHTTSHITPFLFIDSGMMLDELEFPLYALPERILYPFLQNAFENRRFDMNSEDCVEEILESIATSDSALCLKFLIDKGVHIDPAFLKRVTVQNKPRCVETFLQSGLGQQEEYVSCILDAVAFGYDRIVNLFLKDCNPYLAKVVLSVAIENGRTNLIELILEDPRIPSEEFLADAIRAVHQGDRCANYSLQMLLQHCEKFKGTSADCREHLVEFSNILCQSRIS